MRNNTDCCYKSAGYFKISCPLLTCLFERHMQYMLVVNLSLVIQNHLFS